MVAKEAMRQARPSGPDILSSEAEEQSSQSAPPASRESPGETARQKNEDTPFANRIKGAIMVIAALIVLYMWLVWRSSHDDARLNILIHKTLKMGAIGAGMLILGKKKDEV